MTEAWKTVGYDTGHGGKMTRGGEGGGGGGEIPRGREFSIWGPAVYKHLNTQGLAFVGIEHVHGLAILTYAQRSYQLQTWYCHSHVYDFRTKKEASQLVPVTVDSKPGPTVALPTVD